MHPKRTQTVGATLERPVVPLALCGPLDCVGYDSCGIADNDAVFRNGALYNCTSADDAVGSNAGTRKQRCPCAYEAVAARSMNSLEIVTESPIVISE